MTHRATGVLDRIVEKLRAAYPHSRVGLAVQVQGEAEPLYALNAGEFFQAASTTKLITSALALTALGEEFRFVTRLCATSALESDGTIDGDLVLVAAGDPNLSGRVTDQDTLEFTDVDHATGGLSGAAPVERDPLFVLNELAASAVRAGVKRVRGSVFIDTGIFPDAGAEAGTGVQVSSISVNDNIIDVYAIPGSHVGDKVRFITSPETSFVRFLCEATTGTAKSKPAIEFEEMERDGRTRVVKVHGTTPAGRSQLYRYAVPEPARFAAVTLAEALQANGVEVQCPSTDNVEWLQGRKVFTIAEHRSAPLCEAVKIVLKVSQNLHAELLPFAIGVYACGATGERARRAGFTFMHELLIRAGLDLTQAAQGDGCGGLGWFTPAFMCQFLNFVAAQPYFEAFRAALPVMGRDGTLHDTQVKSPAAGSVWAKTGTLVYEDQLNARFMLSTKGLAGYVRTARSANITFAAYIANVPMQSIEDFKHVGDALGGIATALYESF